MFHIHFQHKILSECDETDSRTVKEQWSLDVKCSTCTAHCCDCVVSGFFSGASSLGDEADRRIAFVRNNLAPETEDVRLGTEGHIFSLGCEIVSYKRDAEGG